jgi:hypothetical protein
MKMDTITTGAILGGARLAARINENHSANLPNDFDKFRRGKNHGRLW